MERCVRFSCTCGTTFRPRTLSAAFVSSEHTAQRQVHACRSDRGTDALDTSQPKRVLQTLQAYSSSTAGSTRRCRQQRQVSVCAGRSGRGDAEGSQSAAVGPERWKLYAALIALAIVAATALTYGGDAIQDALYGDGLDFSGGSSGPTPGDVAGAALWGISLYFCSPWQLLLLFLGEVDTERPSDWLLRLLGSATGQPVADPQYSAPLALRAAVVAACAAGGAAIAWAFNAGLGDATWSVSTGLGACIAGAVYEVGRPKRYTPEEAAQLDAEWWDFVAFARERLQRSGNLHESEVFDAFRRSLAKYRSSEAMPDERIRDFARNWAPDVQRTPNGYLKGLSLQQRTDPFTGAATGSAPPSRGSGSAAEGGGRT